ncbi:YqaJ viral recombinase family nuclease [Kushneria aurantia]|uniref:YqaJ viral recombinase family protein n=1 Tax=Kushneria aurantia TaxID=504092 RepID=A0ABV6G6E5_9GAMM|nr:YqaJ viral recombinase family protein [Kushneria aurantia]
MTITVQDALEQLRKKGRVSTLGMDRDVWLELRGYGIGASEAAAAIGISEHRTAYEIAERKLGIGEEDEEASYRRRMKMEMGHVMEPVTALRFSAETGLNVQNHNYMATHEDLPWMMANIDRRVVGVTEEQSAWLEMVFGETVTGPGVVELKNVEFASGWGRPDDVKKTGGLCSTGEIPEDYEAQVQHQLAVTGYEWAFLVVTIGGWETRFYPILRDDEYISMIIEAEADLWGLIKRGELPEIDIEHKNAIDILKRRYPGTDGTVADLSGIEHWIRVESDCREEIKELEVTKRKARAHVLERMGPSSLGLFGDGMRYSRKVQQRKGYISEVAPTEFIDVRIGKINKADQQLIDQARETQQQASEKDEAA